MWIMAFVLRHMVSVLKVPQSTEQLGDPFKRCSSILHPALLWSLLQLNIWKWLQNVCVLMGELMLMLAHKCQFIIKSFNSSGAQKQKRFYWKKRAETETCSLSSHLLNRLIISSLIISFLILASEASENCGNPSWEHVALSNHKTFYIPSHFYLLLFLLAAPGNIHSKMTRCSFD